MPDGRDEAHARLAAALAALDADRLRLLVADVLRLEGFTRITDAPMGSLSAELLEVHHGHGATRVRWIVRAIPAGAVEADLVEAVKRAEQDLHACASRRILLWCAAEVPDFVARTNAHLPAAFRIEARGGERLAAVIRRSPVLAARHLPGQAESPGRYAGWRVLFLHDGSPLDHELLRRLEGEGAFCVAANLLAQEAALEGLADLFAEPWGLVAALAGDVAASSIGPAVVERLAAHLEAGGDVLWNPWMAWAARFGALGALAPYLPVELVAEPGTHPLEALLERRDMRVSFVAPGHQATRGLGPLAPFTLLNTYEPVRLAPGATALATADDGTPLLAVAARGRGRSVYLNASGHSCVGLAVKHSPLDEAPAMGLLLDGVLGWLRATARET